jgi:hypothetical protein
LGFKGINHDLVKATILYLLFFMEGYSIIFFAIFLNTLINNIKIYLKFYFLNVFIFYYFPIKKNKNFKNKNNIVVYFFYQIKKVFKIINFFFKEY